MSVKTHTKMNVAKLWRFIRYNSNVSIGVGISSTFVVLGFILPLLIPYNVMQWNLVPRDKPPSLTYPLGTTSLGQNLFLLLTWSIRGSFLIGFIGSGIGLTIGASLGLIAGYKGGIVERVVLIFTDAFIVLPWLPVIILLSMIIKGELNVVTMGLIVAALTWSMPVRNVRSMVLSLREREFTYTALSSGSGTLKIVLFEYLPHVIPWIMASFVSRILMAVGMEITLAVFGLIPLREATLGTMIYWALEYQALMRGIWWWIATPMITVILLFLSLYLVSMGVVEYLNPRARVRRMTVEGA